MKKAFKKIGIGVGCVVGIYLVACIIMSVFWCNNGIGDYCGDRYGLMVVVFFPCTVTEEYGLNNEWIIAKNKEGYFYPLNAKKFNPGDKVLVIWGLSPFNNVSDVSWWDVHLKIGKE